MNESIQTDQLFAGRIEATMLGLPEAVVFARNWRLIDMPTDKPLYATQRTVFPERIAEYVADRWSRLNLLRGIHPLIVEQGGRFYVADGHHRLIASRYRGEKHMKVWVVSIEGGA